MKEERRRKTCQKYQIKHHQKEFENSGRAHQVAKDQRSIDTFLVRKDVGQNLPNSGKRKCNFVDDNFATGSPSTPKKRNLVGNLASLGVQGKLGQPEK